MIQGLCPPGEIRYIQANRHASCPCILRENLHDTSDLLCGLAYRHGAEIAKYKQTCNLQEKILDVVSSQGLTPAYCYQYGFLINLDSKKKIKKLISD